jgi:RNA polymerase sigma factor (sigma-70 family)
MSDSLALLLDKLSQGDREAVAEAFRLYEPMMRSVVRRQLGPELRAKFDSADVVQSVWADLLEGFRAGSWTFAAPEHLKAFLIRAVRNRFIDRARQHQSARHYEQAAALNELAGGVPSPQPRPSEVAQADELWDLLLARCLPPHREILVLKRQGLRIAEIAVRTGWHEDPSCPRDWLIPRIPMPSRPGWPRS